jgi:hypothetical protein
MCDYSLEPFANRPAVQGEDLVLKEFVLSVGACSPNQPHTAVCLQSGSILLLSHIPDAIRGKLGLSEGPVGATFIQFRASEERRAGLRFYRDGLEFNNGSRILLQELLGARISVLSVGVTEAEQLPLLLCEGVEEGVVVPA